ncbi:DUF4252 domain-containing protein [Maribacter sp. Asnod1-A12]|uniref:DUF4252 domain-containing protein n=1 Tax=Maribacter sp. Asnod1-A12 TaxID=3160576 RepID=UPI00386E900F
MKKLCISVVLLIGIAISSCSKEQSLQQYFIANAENPNFMSFDLPSSLLNLDKVDLSASEKEVAASLKKMNVLVFQKKIENIADYEIQKSAINSILKSSEYNELMKMNTSMGKATIQIKGDGDTIDEVIVYGDNDDKGLILVRVLGDDMNPASFVQIVKKMEKSDFNVKGIKLFDNLIKG